MSVTTGDVRRWLDAGIVDSATADRILAFEDEAGAGLRRAERAAPAITEVLVYLAAAIVAAGITVLVATNWEHLGLLPRLLIPGLSAIVALVSGQVLRHSARPDVVRASGIAWVLAAGLLTATVAIAADEAGWEAENITLAAGLGAVVFTIPLWWLSKTSAQVVGIAGALLLLSLALTSRSSGDNGAAVFGLSLAGFATIALIATEAGVLAPRLAARILGAAGLALGAFYAGLPPGPTPAAFVALVASIALFAASMRFSTLIYMIAAVFIAFAGLVTAILRHIDNTTLAALALIAVGLALLAAIALIARRKPWREPEFASAGEDVPATARRLRP